MRDIQHLSAVTHIVDSIWMEEIPPQIYDIVTRKRVVSCFHPNYCYDFFFFFI
jgi:hypothetical protein